jgi:two-component system chemotaxis response regulator CheB
VYGPRVIGVVLSGSLDDGTAGLWQIKDRGGVAIVQSPDDALHPSMPQSALEHVAVDHCVPASRMGDLITSLVNQDLPLSSQERVDALMATENRIAMGNDPLTSSRQLGPASAYTCPECHGSMVEITQDSVHRYRCHTGHAFSQQTLLAHFGEQVDDHLWNALRALDERVMMLQQLAQEAQSRGSAERANEFLADIERSGELRRQLREATLAIGQS